MRDKNEETMSQKFLRVVVLGGPQTGKTNLVSRFCENKFATSYIKTIGVDFTLAERRYLEQRCALKIWTISDDEDFNGTYCEGGDVFIIVLDAEDHEVDKVFEEQIDKYFKQIVKERSKNTAPFTIAIAINKSDLVDEGILQNIATRIKQDVEQRMKRFPNDFKHLSGAVQVVQTSAKNGEGVNELFRTAVETVLPDLDLNPSDTESKQMDQSTEECHNVTGDEAILQKHYKEDSDGASFNNALRENYRPGCRGGRLGRNYKDKNISIADAFMLAAAKPKSATAKALNIVILKVMQNAIEEHYKQSSLNFSDVLKEHYTPGCRGGRLGRKYKDKNISIADAFTLAAAKPQSATAKAFREVYHATPTLNM